MELLRERERHYAMDVEDVKKTMRRIVGDVELTAGACHKGITEMLRTSYFPVLPRLLFERGIAPNVWFQETRLSSPGLSYDLIRYCLKVDPQKGIQKLRRMRLPFEGVSRVDESIYQALQWRKLIDNLSNYSVAIRDLGLVWYLDVLSEDEEVLLIAAEDLDFHLDEIDERIRGLVEHLNEEISEQRGKEKQPLVKWDAVFRLPI